MAAFASWSPKRLEDTLRMAKGGALAMVALVGSGVMAVDCGQISVHESWHLMYRKLVSITNFVGTP
jgi:hypothetical protein